MEKRRAVTYVILYLLAVLAVAVLSYLVISAYFGLPAVPPSVSRLVPASIKNALPKAVKEKLLPSPTRAPTTGEKPASVEKVTLKNGQYFYEVRGKFAVKPYYQSDILRAEFIIDEDPNNSRIPVIMTAKTGKINVGRSQGSFSGTTVWKLEDTEALRLSIKPGEPARLRIQFFSPVLSEHDKLVKATLEGIMNGNWNIPEGFIFIPMMVGVVE
ncbi:hypothetical protein KKB64_01770 [Patescibacteria group bacterium]|nr:hypothetical protein [Patescibacteria group bacterium]MBU1472499.1 hypothetical protein [Patescibacteria group bacterium]MBU2459544.1 hypothetical protein [Patescibacteria group bacterium]MBU2543867.1 hypothetical protein [Patescibacteria group bacterium]